MSFGYPQPQGQEGPPLEIENFSGGKTDVFIDGENNSYKEADNLLVDENAKMRTRPGTVVFDEDNAQTPSGNARIGEFIRTDNILYEQVGTALHYILSGAFNTLFGPTGNPAFTHGDAGSHIAWSEWNKHYILTNDDFSYPQKLFHDTAGNPVLVQCGLPSAADIPAYSFANDIKAKFNAHIADGAAHGGPFVDTVNTVLSPDATDLDSLVTLTNELTTKYKGHDDDAELLSPNFHQAQETSDNSLSSLLTVSTLSECLDRLNEIKLKFNAHDADPSSHVTSSSYQVISFSEPTAAGSPGSNAYIYTLVAFYQYMVGTVTYQDLGPTFSMQVENVETPDVLPINVTGIPTIANGSVFNWDTANIYWQLYRTQANGTSSTLLATLTNGTSSYVDSTADADIEFTRPLYTDGGISQNEAPPRSKYNVTVNNCTWYGHVKLGTSEYKSRLYQSIAFDPDSVPGDYFIDIEDEIVGLGAINIYPIVFCKNHIYRVEGQIDEAGNGELIKREISRTIGGINHMSIVDAREGLFFCGNDGFYFTDGFKIQKLSHQLDESYKDLIQTNNQKERITGEYEKENDRIYWAVTESTASSDNDKIWVLDLKWGISERSTFTTISNIDSWSPSALGVTPDEKKFVIGDRRGYIFNFDSQIFTDPKIDTGEAAADWDTKAIIYDFEWIKSKFGTSYNRKWISGIVVNLENVTNLSLEIQGENDNSGAFHSLKEIRFRENITWGDEAGPEWGDFEKDYLWNTFPLISEKRRFPAKTLRCTYKSVRFTNSNTIITTSDQIGTATVDFALKTATLDTVGAQWPSDCVDQFLTFEQDDYALQYQILERTSDTVVTFLDVSASAPSGSTKWELRGIAKGEVFAINNFSIQWLPIGASHLPYVKSVSGENA